MATTSISSRKQNFPMLPFLVSPSLGGILPRGDRKGKGKERGTVSGPISWTESMLQPGLSVTQRCCSAPGLIKDTADNGRSRREHQKAVQAELQVDRKIFK